jgi:DNA (cytosine-5)-methyltransferase 1
LNLKVLDLFAGVGGFSSGFEQAGFTIAAAVELDTSIADSLQKNHKNTKVYNRNISNIEPSIIKKDIGNIDVIIGGPPCQGFSLRGKRKGLDDNRNFLFKKFIEYVEFFKPQYFVMENVPAILTDQNGYFKDQIIKSFNDLGYKTDVQVLNSINFGVPQNRKRAFFLGKLNDTVKLPAKTIKDDETVTVWDAISDLAYLDSSQGEFEASYKCKAQSNYQQNRRKNSKKLYNHKATNHSKVALDRLKRIPPECGKEYLKEKISSTFGQTWGRLEKNKPSPTIITRFDTPSNGKNSHPFLHRAITPREAARIQSFDDDFIFYGNKTSVIKQIGNAVPPLMAKAIAQVIKDDYES